MESKYQKYYDALKGKDFSSPINKYTSALSNAKTKVESAETIINSSQWIEKGLEIIKESILPSLKDQETQLEQGITALTTAVGKINTLVSKLEELDNACTSYNNCSDDNEEEKKKYANKIDSLEKEIDSIINEINGVSFNYTSQQATFATHINNLKENTDLEARKAQFVGNVDDPNQFYIDPAFANKMGHMTLFDNTTGEILKDGDVLELKPGETRILTVKLPDYCGQIDQVIRTTGQDDASKVISNWSDIDPDPNNIEYIRVGKHVPNNINLHFNSYDWIITANRDGTFLASQTCEFKSHGTDSTGKSYVFSGKKAMVAIRVNVRS